ncbi:isocitrate lyase/phosphoenolpyruvate mutase family protein [Escherichia coli]|nr:isocitrate lyase/phosphoenolpyruvate mutase family protein [Escherichia coli]
MSLHSPGKAFRAALTKENPLQIVGTINANHALLAQRAGYQAIYLSGGGVAVDAKTDPDFVIMARTDALAVEGLDAAIERAQAYVEAGAEMLFPEAITELAMYRQFADAVQVPILANITEFGATPLFTTDELRSAHVAMALYPLSAFRAMNRAAEHVYNVLRQEGTQKSVIDTMQTRNELYESINYYQYEEKLDDLFARSQAK